MKADLTKLKHQFIYARNPEFDLGFDSHDKQRVYAGSLNGFKQRQ